MVCIFFGHKDAPQSLFETMKEEIKRLIIQKNADRFIVGNQGAFDTMVLRALRELKYDYPHIQYSIALAYMPANKAEFELYDSSETLFPEGIETVPKRFAISWRNRWMVKHSDMLVCYVTHSWGSAAQFTDYARRQGKEIFNLAETQIADT